jgi:hypothetical protein
MKNLLLGLLMLFSVSCVGAARTPYSDDRGDLDADYAQSIMRNAVKIEESITVRSTPYGGTAEDIEERKMSSSGSGVIVATDEQKGTSKVLTAWHVCDRYPVGYKVEGLFSDLEVIKDTQEVISASNKRIKILSYLYRDKDSDICVIEIDHAFKYHAEFASEMPPRGAVVSVVGAPLGEWGKFMVSMQDGRYFGLTTIEVVAGIDDEEPTTMTDFAYYGFAGVGGYSGSGVYYKGKLIGLHTAGAGRYEHASYGPALDDITWAVGHAN